MRRTKRNEINKCKMIQQTILEDIFSFPRKHWRTVKRLGNSTSRNKWKSIITLANILDIFQRMKE